MIIVRPPSAVAGGGGTGAWPKAQSNVTAASSAGTTLTVPMPAGLASGKRLILFVSSYGKYFSGGGLSGWTLVQRADNDYAGSMVVYTKVATGSEGSLTLTGFYSADPRVAALVMFEPSTIHVSSQRLSTIDEAGTTPHYTSPVTTTLDNCLLVRAIGSQAYSTTPTTYTWDSGLSAYLSMSESSGTEFYENLSIVITSLATAATAPVRQVTPSNPPAISGWGAVTLALV